ncbi:hypothetical protein GCM10009861_20520 [Neomicrococcus aestuarii]
MPTLVSTRPELVEVSEGRKISSATAPINTQNGQLLKIFLFIRWGDISPSLLVEKYDAIRQSRSQATKNYARETYVKYKV